MPTRILNLGVVAHVDAGKTTLTEQLLFATGASDHIGRVDHGDTVTDSDALERERGITIRAAVATFVVGDLRVNLLDTPGHIDFVAEVERSLAVLDAVVLVVSAVEGVQAQTRVLLRTIERLGLPCLVFLNKIDRAGARVAATLDALAATSSRLPLLLGRADHVGTGEATVSGWRTGPTAPIAETLSTIDEGLVAGFVDGAWPPSTTVLDSMITQHLRAGTIISVVPGSALAGVGVAELLAELDAVVGEGRSAEDAPGELAADVFKVEPGRGPELVAYVKIISGSLRARCRVPRWRADGGADAVSPTSVRPFVLGNRTDEGVAGPGEIALVRGVPDVAIGDRLGRPRRSAAGTLFQRPALEARVVPAEPGQGVALFRALTVLTRTDPLIDAHLDPLDQQPVVSLYGEVQQQVIMERLRREFGVVAGFAPVALVHRERVVGCGEAVLEIGRDAPFPATVGLRVESGPVDADPTYELRVGRGQLLPAFYRAIEETVPLTLSQGLFGWPVGGCTVALTAAGYAPPATTAAHFRHTVPLVLSAALQQAGTRVCEPYSAVEVDVPDDHLGPALTLLAEARGRTSVVHGDGRGTALSVIMPTAELDRVRRALPGLTGGEAVVVARPSGFRPVRGNPPTKPRSDGNPLDRVGYLRFLSKGGDR